MPVDSRHPSYEYMLPQWVRMRDAVAGEDAIKAKGSDYLPLPPGIEQPWGENDPQYLNYIRRAPYPDVVAPTIQGMVGLMGRKETQIELPSALERLRDQATPEGLDLQGLLDRVRHEVMTLGRYVLFVDAPADGGEPFIATYAAESLINWRTDGDRLTMAVFEESSLEPKADDPFEAELVTQYREASMIPEVDDEGEPIGQEVYTVRLWQAIDVGDGKKQFVVVDETVPTVRGEPFETVPAVIIGSRDLLTEPDQVPMVGVANRALDYYRQVADYRLGLFMSTQATPYATGIKSEEKPTRVGPSTFWAAETPDAKFGYAEVSGAGLESQRQALSDTHDEIMNAAMRVIGDGKSAESGEALRLRFQSQTATLTTVAISTATGLEVALRMVAQWIGAESDQVAVRPDTDFIHEEPDPQVLSTIGNMVERGLLPEQALSGYARKTNLADLDDEAFRQETPTLMGQNPGDEL